MKRLCLFLVTILTAAISSAQGTYQWIGANDASWQVSSNWAPNRTAANNGDTLLFSGGGSSAISNCPSQTVARIRVFGNTSITFKGGTNSQTLTIGNGTDDDFIVESGSTLIQDATLETISMAGSATADISGTYINYGGFSLSSSNVVATVKGVFDNNGSTTGANATKLQFGANSYYYHSINSGNIPMATWNATSTCEIKGTINNGPGNLGQSFGNFTWNCASQLNNQQTLPGAIGIAGNLKVVTTGAGRLEMGQDLSVGGDFVMENGYFIVSTGNTNRALDIVKNLSISNGTILMSNSNNAGRRGDINLYGNFTQSGGDFLEANNGSGNIYFAGTSLQLVSRTGGTISNTVNIIVNANAIVDFGTSVMDGDGSFTITDGAKVITSNADGFRSTGLFGSIRNSGTRTFATGADYEFRGASTGTFSTAVRNLIVNNTSGSVTLSQPITVNGQLTLTAGRLNTTSTNLLTVGVTGSTTSPTSSSFVNGPMAKTGNTAFTFPVGKAGAGYRTIGISAPSVSSTFTAEFFKSDPRVISTTLGTGLTQISACEYWTLERTGSGSANVVLSWEAGSACGTGAYVTNPGTLRVAHFNGSSWINEGRSSTTGDNTAGTITSGNTLTTFSPFALAGNTISENPLPVMFADVKAFSKNSGVQIEWSNLTERDLTGYFVQRSSNGTDFTDITTLQPKSNQNDKASYSYFDATPLNGLSFYRIRVAEKSGKIIYSKILRAEMGDSRKGFTFYPNPVIGSQFTINLTGMRPGNYTLRVINSNGQKVYEKSIVNQGSSITQTLDLPPSVKAGVYTGILMGADFNESKMFIVR